jgi:hypothetical protein
LTPLTADIGKLIFSFLDASSLRNLSHTCKALLDYGNTTELMTAWLRYRKADFLEALRGQKRRNLGLVFAHKYSFDGLPEVPEKYLRGVDAVMYQALSNVFGPAKMSECFLANEQIVDYEDYGEYEHPFLVKVCVAVTDNPYSMDDLWGEGEVERLKLPDVVARRYWKTHITPNAANR